MFSFGKYAAYGVMEYWSHGVMVKRIEKEYLCLVPVLQYSNTPLLQFVVTSPFHFSIIPQFPLLIV
jgi:hypothetical protein